MAHSIAPAISPVYPRWRGEHSECLISISAGLGLSPLARGTLVTITHYGWYPRFIPAYIHRKRITAGLSPLARGTPGYCQHDEKQRRFIPAGAGNTSDRIKQLYRRPVYPRWRGEHG